MTRTSIIAPLLGLLASSCGPSQLNQLRDVVLTVRTEVAVWVSLAAAGTPQTGCAELPGAKATWNGTPMRLLTAGGSSAGPSLAAPNQSECIRPTFAADGYSPNDGLVEFVVSDGTATFTTSVHGARAVRPLTLANDGGTLQQGQPATVVWPTPSESLTPGRTEIVLLELDGGGRRSVLRDEVTVAGAEVRFTVPTTFPSGGVSVVVDSKQVALTHCEGPSSCLIDVALGSVRATIGP